MKHAGKETDQCGVDFLLLKCLHKAVFDYLGDPQTDHDNNDCSNNFHPVERERFHHLFDDGSFSCLVN